MHLRHRIQHEIRGFPNVRYSLYKYFHYLKSFFMRFSGVRLARTWRPLCYIAFRRLLCAATYGSFRSSGCKRSAFVLGTEDVSTNARRAARYCLSSFTTLELPDDLRLHLRFLSSTFSSTLLRLYDSTRFSTWCNASHWNIQRIYSPNGCRLVL